MDIRSFNKQKDFKVPVFVVAGCGDRLVCLQSNFDRCNAFTKDIFLDESMHFNDFIKLLNEHCLHGIWQELLREQEGDG